MARGRKFQGLVAKVILDNQEAIEAKAHVMASPPVYAKKRTSIGRLATGELVTASTKYGFFMLADAWYRFKL